MGNTCRRAHKKSKRQLSLEANNAIFDFNLILSELDKYPLEAVNTKLIVRELSNLNSVSIAVQDYGLSQFNVLLANVLCSTCFSKEQFETLVKLVLEYNSAVNLNDLLLSCLEFASPAVSHLILDRIRLGHGSDQNQEYKLR